MNTPVRLVLFTVACAVLVAAPAAVGQNAGDVVAGQQSPWGNAHYVLAAYALVWGGIVAYSLRLRLLVKKLREELTALSDEQRPAS